MRGLTANGVMRWEVGIGGAIMDLIELGTSLHELAVVRLLTWSATVCNLAYEQQMNLTACAVH